MQRFFRIRSLLFRILRSQHKGPGIYFREEVKISAISFMVAPIGIS